MYDVQKVRGDFPILDKVVYLDSAATSLKPVQVLEAMKEFFYEYSANYGRGAHRLAKQATERYEAVREEIARFIGAQPEELIFTKSTTEAINLVALGLQWERGDQVIATSIEHHSNLLPWQRLQKHGVKLEIAAAGGNGVITPSAVEAAITKQTKLIAITQVSNTFGTIQPVEEIAKLARDSNILLLIDAAQSIGHLRVNVKELDCDFIAISGHKGLLGPQGTGALYARDPSLLEPVYVGGGAVQDVTPSSFKWIASPARFEAGTPNLPGVIGLGRGLRYVQETGIENIRQHIESLSSHLDRGLKEIENVETYGASVKHGIVSFNIKGMNCHDVALILDETRRICVRSGHHCASLAIKQLGVEGTVRASFGLYNTMEEVDLLIETVKNIAEALV
ncbi:MAG: cysteine desulfurase [Methanocellales archaeon]